MIYFIQDTKSKAIKIGVSHNPADRLKALQTAHSAPLVLLAVMDGGRQEEAALHRMFSRLNGEWFEASAELLTYIRLSALPMQRLRSGPAHRQPRVRVEPLPDDEITPIDIATSGYDDRFVWNVALLAINKKNGEYKYSSWKIAKFMVTRGDTKHQKRMCSDIERMVFTIRNMPRADVNRILANAPPEVRASDLWSNLVPD